MERSIGFIGLGEMGLPMAKNLIKAGYELNAFDTDKHRAKEAKKSGARISASPAEAARSSGTIIVMVRTVDQVKAVFTGKDGLLVGASGPRVVLIMSTIDPVTVQQLSGLAAEKGIAVLDCPVSGAKQGAEAGTLTIMVGGPEETYTGCKPIFEAMGKNIFYLGKIGMGESAKLINNLLLLVHMIAAYEAVSIAQKAEIKMDVLLDLIRVSTGNSWIIEHWDMVRQWKDNYVEGGTLDLVYKDIKLTMVMGEALKVPLQLSALAAQLGRY